MSPFATSHSKLTTGALGLAVAALLAGCVETTSDGGSRTPSTGESTVVRSNDRFPAISEARLQALASNAHCAPTITSVARTAARTATHRGYAIQICNTEDEKEGYVVAWTANGSRELVITTPDGRPFPRRAGNVNDGPQEVQWGVFGIRLQGGLVACGVPFHHHLNEPFSAAHCTEFRD